VSDHDGREMVKMSVFAERSGVPVPTIKHYLREGLLPDPTRTSRNMAYYDAALIPRVRAIKRLQRTLFLPLRVIRQVLDRLGDGEVPADIAVEATVARVLGDLAPRESLSRRQLLAGGVTEEELQLFESIGIVTPEIVDGEPVFRGDDVSLLRVLGQARRAGLTAQMLPTEMLRDYVEAVQRLIRLELELFRAGVVPAAGDDLAKLTEAATTLSERLVVLLRRKLVLPTLRALTREDRREDA
jgi:DNA-binding transcriptional MerR regulator